VGRRRRGLSAHFAGKNGTPIRGPLDRSDRDGTHPTCVAPGAAQGGLRRAGLTRGLLLDH